MKYVPVVIIKKNGDRIKDHLVAEIINDEVHFDLSGRPDIEAGDEIEWMIPPGMFGMTSVGESV